MAEIRSEIISFLKRDFIGPDPLFHKKELIQENGEEILEDISPLKRYLAGVLFPTALKSASEDEDSSGNSDEDPVILSNEIKQSAISLTVSTPIESCLQSTISGGIYQKTVNHKTTLYKRLPFSFTVRNLNVRNLIEKMRTTFSFEVTSAIRIELVCIVRRHDERSAFLTFSLVNASVHDEDNKDKEEKCLFQTELVVENNIGFNALPDTDKPIMDDDVASNAMLYRKVKTFGMGHGCSAVWSKSASNVVTRVSSSIFPEAEIKPIVPSVIDGIDLSMKSFSDVSKKADILNVLNTLCNNYKLWIDDIEMQSVDAKDANAKIQHLRKCRECQERIKLGIDSIANDEQVFRAFAWMNEAMLMQQLHYNLPNQEWNKDKNTGKMYIQNPITMPIICDEDTWFGDKRRYGKWRPFQLAFILMNINSFKDEYSIDRQKVDLIWFPTGGGKTEAYLGLSAFVIFYRKIRDPLFNGTSILMRYTLRLLTSQQYSRAASMICACESIRKRNVSVLGTSKITIGLWVGNETTPGTNEEAKRKIRERLDNPYANNPFLIRKCPWCGAEMGFVDVDKHQEKIGYETKSQKPHAFYFRCNNHECEFSHKDEGLPLLIIDELIYEEPPTLLLGTVDKFATLPFHPKARSIFGIAADGGIKTPPELIIQDELHLISGPLGSMVGMYETVINELCTLRKDGLVIKPKIVASTATISRAKEQCNALYACGCENVVQFPPSGISYDDSFFAHEDVGQNGRKYIGIHTSNTTYSAVTTAIRMFACLIYAVGALKGTDKDKDPYWTNIGYFNSIKELGQMSAMLSSEVSEYLNAIYDRYNETKSPTKRLIDTKQLRELTSRIRGDEISSYLGDLEISLDNRNQEKKAIDVCLSSNMISVGVDVPRLGLMTVNGQPKTTSEYIQATSRVGRDANRPGLVFVVYNASKPRDRSHYERFWEYHSKIYCNVEPTSVTPFSSPVRDRFLASALITLWRLKFDIDDTQSENPSEEFIRYAKDVIKERIEKVSMDELEDAQSAIDRILQKWEAEAPDIYGSSLGRNSRAPLMIPFGVARDPEYSEAGFSIPTSMRDVDKECSLRIINYYGRNQ